MSQQWRGRGGSPERHGEEEGLGLPYSRSGMFEEIPLQEECELGFNRNCFQFSDVTVIDFNLKYMHYITIRERNIFQRRFKVPLLTGGLFLRQVEG